MISLDFPERDLAGHMIFLFQLHFVSLSSSVIPKIPGPCSLIPFFHVFSFQIEQVSGSLWMLSASWLFMSFRSFAFDKPDMVVVPCVSFRHSNRVLESQQYTILASIIRALCDYTVSIFGVGGDGSSNRWWEFKPLQTYTKLAVIYIKCFLNSGSCKVRIRH